MKQALLIFALTTLTLATFAATPPEDLTLNGTYVWSSSPNEPGDLRAVFTPAGEGKWTVNFYFHFSGRDRIYTGTAEGDLSNGNLKGEVKNEEKKRTFTFEGTTKNGDFSGQHAEVGGRYGSRKTGTLELKK